jgi:glycosyltransferase involved in cell wall biosynthesis
VRIAQVVPRGEQPWSGVLTVIVHLSAALAKLGHHVEVWQLNEWDSDAYADQRTRLESAGVPRVLVASRGSLRSVGRVAGGLAHERSMDLIHLHGAFNPSNTAISRALDHPFVFSPHSGYDPVSLRRSWIRKRLYRWLFERPMLDRAAMLIALTDVERDQLRAYGARRPVLVIPNGVASPTDGVDGRAARRALGISEDVPLAVFVGRLDVYRKGLDLLVEGIADAPRWHAALVGPEFRGMRRLRKTISRLGVDDRVHIVGERHGEQLRGVMAAADVFALMSRWEGMPMALLEAMSLSKPAVVSHAVDRVIHVGASGAGWATEPKDLGTLLQHLDGADGREEVARRGRRALSLSSDFTWDSVAQQYAVAYQQAWGTAPRGAP